MKEKPIKPYQETFLKLICTEMTYKEIGSKIGVSDQTCRDYTKTLCIKYRVKGRFGLMLYAIKTKIVKINEIKFQMEGRPPLYERFPVAFGGTLLLEKQSPILREEQKRLGKSFEENVQEGLGQN